MLYPHDETTIKSVIRLFIFIVPSISLRFAKKSSSISDRQKKTNIAVVEQCFFSLIFCIYS